MYGEQNPFMIYIKYNPPDIRYYVTNTLLYHIRMDDYDKFILSNYFSFSIYVLNTIYYMQRVSFLMLFSIYKYRLIIMMNHLTYL